jgi:formylglycine-generating enzyme required for sulfatase activity
MFRQPAVLGPDQTGQAQPHTAVLTLDAGAGGQARIPVSVGVPLPCLALSSAALDLGAAYQGETLTGSFTVSNRGGSACEAEVTSTAGWATVSPARFRCEPGTDTRVAVAAITGHMGLGQHTARLSVTARAGGWTAADGVAVRMDLPWLKAFWARYRRVLVPALAGLLIFLTVTAMGAYQEQQKRACYNAGLALLQASQWEQAVAQFEQCRGYRDAPQKVLEARVQAGLLWTNPLDGAIYVRVPAGEFLMGSRDADTEAGSNEKPQHTVYLDGYWIMQTEVTKDQYQKCVAAGQCAEPGCRGTGQGNHPVVCVSWQDAVNYCAWAGCRLPTEAEWEKAARGTDGRKYPWGDDAPDCDKAQYGACAGTTVAVGSKPAGVSPYGALDMAGNVQEWVADWYDGGYYARSPGQNPPGPDSGSSRVVRGGRWNFAARLVRAASRYGYSPDLRDYRIDFRPARSD